jgi:hypothetical protein
MADHVMDPDHWKRKDSQEGPRHFLDCEAYGGPAGVPRDEDAARARLGADLFQRSGQVPWVIQAHVGYLTRAFKSGDAERTAFEAAILCHYVGDINVPLHTTSNYDGDETGQHGVHGRWESGLTERIVNRAGWFPGRVLASPGGANLDDPWTWLRQSFDLVPSVLADDRTAAGEGPAPLQGMRDEGYWKAYMDLQGPRVKEQLERSAAHTADMIVLAWVNAGSPPSPLRAPKPGRTAGHPN